MDAHKLAGMNNDYCRVRNPEGTKRAVLCAARKLFTERGFAGTSMRDISAASGVSQPLIHHHFGGKDDLYSAVRRSIVEDIVARDPEVVLATDRPADIRAELVRLFEFVRENESLLRMMAWSRLEGKHRMTAGDLELKQAMVRRVEVAQRMGLVRKDMDPRFVVIMIQGCVCHWLENREFHADLFDGKPDDEAYLQEAIALLERGLGVGGEVASAEVMAGRVVNKMDPNQYG